MRQPTEELQKFDLSATSYTHKKFDLRALKRRHHEVDVFGQQIEVQNELQENVPQVIWELQDRTELQPEPKRTCRQTKALFRPWLIEELHHKGGDSNKNKNKNNKSAIQVALVASLPPPSIVQYHANMVRSHPHKQRSPKEELRRYRNTLACLRSRRAKRAAELEVEQEYATFTQKNVTVWEQSLRAALYLKHLRQLLQVKHVIEERQQREFTKGHNSCSNH